MSLINLTDIEQKQIAKGYFSRLVHSEKMTFSFVTAAAGEELPEHAHPHEQISIIQEGIFELTLDGKPIRFTKGQLVIIPSNVKHAGKAITDAVILDVFYPVREDYQKLSGK